MRVGEQRLTLNEKQLLERVIGARDPSLLPVLDHLGHLSEDEREALRDVLSDELCERGLDAEDEPTSYGKAVDSIIGSLLFY